VPLSLEHTLFRGVGNIVSPAGARGKLAIFIYHRVLATADPLLPGLIDAAVFERQMALVAAEFNVLPLNEACERLRKCALPARALSITFDDGYADNEQIALPILKRFGLSATFFVATGFSDGGIMFNDAIIHAVRHAENGPHDLSAIGIGKLELDGIASRQSAIDAIIAIVKHRPLAERDALVARTREALAAPPQDRLMMDAGQILALHRAGMEIGAHTVRHPILRSVSEREARTEIVESRSTLEDITRSPVTLFAYPNGQPGADYDVRDVRLVQECGFAAAVSTIPGVAHSHSDLFQLPRLGPWERNPRRLGLRVLAGCARPAVA
jgi:peptidoglycan/xylan/chitin deacetylase (PgdA/CDA1 family)